jgi:transcriptional regulator with XRE-family HTH domain
MNSIGEYIREQREQAKVSLRQLAQTAGVSNPYLSQIERGLRKPSAEILQQIAKGLRISAEALYVQAGILEDRPTDSGVRHAMLADPYLTERQKQVLIEIYESFRRESGDVADAEVVLPTAIEATVAAGAAVAAEAAVADGAGVAGRVVGAKPDSETPIGSTQSASTQSASTESENAEPKTTQPESTKSSTGSSTGSASDRTANTEE